MCFFRALSNLDALFTHTQLFSSMKKRQTTVTSGIQFSLVCLRYIAVASLCSPTYSDAQATCLQYLIHSIPFWCSDYMTTPTTPATSALGLWVDGFAWFFMLCHHCSTDGPSSLDISLTLKSQKWHLAVAKNVAKSHRKRYKSQELNNANSDKLRSPKSVENWVSYSSPKFRGQMQKNGA